MDLMLPKPIWGGGKIIHVIVLQSYNQNEIFLFSFSLGNISRRVLSVGCECRRGRGLGAYHNVSCSMMCLVSMNMLQLTKTLILKV